MDLSGFEKGWDELFLDGILNASTVNSLNTFWGDSPLMVLFLEARVLRGDVEATVACGWASASAWG